jgi:integrase
MQKTADIADIIRFPQKQRAARSDVRYWEAAVFMRKRGCKRSRNFSVQLQHEGRREEFNLGSANKAQAARLAREISQYLRVNGWEATLRKYKPRASNAKIAARFGESGISTVGELIAAISSTQSVDRTLRDYIGRFRQIVAEISFPRSFDEKTKFDYRGGGRQTWLSRIDAVPLAEITPSAVQAWKIAYLARAGNSPAALRAAKISVNSTLRLARCLFSPKQLAFVPLPEGFISPFDQVKFEPRQSCRYRSKFNARDLLARAQEGLATGDLEAYKAFLLLLLCGLRRSEVDKLQWRAFDFSRGQLHIEPTEHLKVKSQDSIGAIDLEPQFVLLFFSLMGHRTGNSFVIEEHTVPAATPYRSYRCKATFERLSTWLRANGLAGVRKPLHTLRKEFGSQVCDRHGIYAASRALRHGDIRTTASFYLDKRSVATTGLGALL